MLLPTIKERQISTPKAAADVRPLALAVAVGTGPPSEKDKEPVVEEDVAAPEPG
jgi:hypothetical protein